MKVLDNISDDLSLIRRTNMVDREPAPTGFSVSSSPTHSDMCTSERACAHTHAFTYTRMYTHVHIYTQKNVVIKAILTSYIERKARNNSATTVDLIVQFCSSSNSSSSCLRLGNGRSYRRIPTVPTCSLCFCVCQRQPSALHKHTVPA